MNKLKEVINSSPLDEEKLTDPTVLATLHVFSAMSLESLQSVWKSVESDEELRGLYLDVLPRTGSSPAALFIKELVLSGKLSEFEARRSVAFFPFYQRFPNEKLLTAWEELLKENPNIKSKYDFSCSCVKETAVNSEIETQGVEKRHRFGFRPLGRIHLLEPQGPPVQG